MTPFGLNTDSTAGGEQHDDGGAGVQHGACGRQYAEVAGGVAGGVGQRGQRRRVATSTRVDKTVRASLTMTHQRRNSPHCVPKRFHQPGDQGRQCEREPSRAVALGVLRRRAAQA